MKAPAAGLAVLSAALALAAPAAEPDGEALYARHCALCHDAGEGHPGTMRLAARAGPAAAVLLERTDLGVDYVAGVVRSGFQMMPPFRPTEIDDEALARLAAWVTAGPRAGSAR